MARIKKRVKRSISIVLILAILLIGGIAVKNVFFSKEDNPVKNFIKEKVKKEDPIKVYKAKLIATGDGLIHSPIYQAARTTDGYDFSHMLTYTKDLLKDYDIKYYNQETVFDDSRPVQSYPRFNTPSAFGRDMIGAGFNLVSLASNHSMDMGGDSGVRSATWWESQEGILATGMASSEEKRNEHKIMDANGITYTMLSYTYGTNGMPIPQDKPWVVNVFNEEQAKLDIEAVRDKVDILIVAMHWGQEYMQTATEVQRNQAKFLAENGVDIVLGNHSHSLQPWERINDTIVFYSFGNFISNQMGAQEARVRKVGVIGGFGTLDITKTHDTRDDTKTIKIDNIGFEFNYTYKHNNNGKTDYTVIPFSKMEDRFLNYYYQGQTLQAVYDEFSSVLKAYDDSIIIKPLQIKEPINEN